MTKNGIQNSIAFTDKGPRKGWRTPLNIINDSEQRDEEKEGSRGPFASERGDEPRSGMPNGSTYLYTYFGARYMDHELMTMWLSVDPMADKYPGISPNAYCAWNPVKLVDPDGREVINRHTKNIENLKKEIADLEGQIKDCNGSNLKELEGKLAGKKKSLKEEMKYEKIVDNAIQDLKNYGGDEFGKLDQLTDVNGNKVDVYIQMVDYIDKIGGPEGKTYGDVRSDGPCSSIMGPNTMLISLSHKYRDVAGKVLAHEGGHVLFDVKFPHVLAAFYSLHPSAERNGHDQDNPSGKMANAYENRYEENRRRTIK